MKTPTLEEQVEEFDDELTKIGYREREGKITLLEAQKLEDKAIRQALLTAEKRGVEKAVKCFPEGLQGRHLRPYQGDHRG